MTGGTFLSEISSRLEWPSTVASEAIGRRELLIWIVVCLFANQTLLLLDVVSFDTLAASLLTQNDIYWLACGVTLYRVFLSDPIVRADRFDYLFALGFGALILSTSLLPYRFGVGLVATLVALYLLLRDHGDHNLKAAGAVLLAVSMQLVWGPIFFQLFTPELLKADAALVGTVLMALRPDVVWSGTGFFAPDGHVVLLIAACSSFNNVSSAVLACVAVTMFRRHEWDRSDIATMIITSVVMILVNALRICLFVWSIDYHQFWHDGAGAQILAIAQTLVVLAVAWWGAAPSRRTS